MHFNQRKKGLSISLNLISFIGIENYLNLNSSDTVSFFLPLALRLANTLRPFAVAILSRKPCLFLLFLFDG